jgi:hypothetical protein
VFLEPCQLAGWGWFMACGYRIAMYSKTFILKERSLQLCLYHPRVFDEERLSAERKIGNGRMVVIDDLLQLRIEILFLIK